MKVVKMIISYLLVVILFFAIPALNVLIIFNSFLSKNTINEIMNSLVASTVNSTSIDENTYIHTLLDETLDSTEVPKEVLDYIDFDIINESLSEYYSNFIKYELGIIDGSELKIDDLKEKINEAVYNYENKTGTDLDTSFMNEYLDEMNEKLKNNQSIPEYDQYSGYLKKVGTLVNPKNIIIISIIIILDLILIIVLNKSISFPIKTLIPIMLLNAIGLGAITLISKNIVINSSKLVKEVIHTLTSIIDKLAIGSGIILIILIISLIIINIITKHKQKEQIPDIPITN